MTQPPRRNTRASLRQLAKLRRVCRSLPDTVEVQAWGEPTFRRRAKMYAMFASPGTHHGQGRAAVWILSEAQERDMLVQAVPQQYFVPAYMGKSGWIGVYLDETSHWDEIEKLLEEGHRLAGLKQRRA